MKQIPMMDLKLEYEYMKRDINLAIERCLAHQKWIFGPEVEQLETAVAEYIGVKHCIGVSSGTEALVLSLRSLALELKGQEYFDKSDKIITTSFTFTATGDAVLRAGATPVFIDIDHVTYNIDLAKIREYLIHNSSNVVGIIPVHLYGQFCKMDGIMELAAEHNLFVLEDVAQAFGGMWKGKKLGSIGNIGAFSFFPSKNLGGFGDGGMVSTDNDKLAEIVKMLIKHGGKNKYNVDHIGYNARLDTLQAAVVLAKFKYIDEFNKNRRRIAEIYNRGFVGLHGIILPCSTLTLPEGHVCNQYTIRVTDGRRDELQHCLKGMGISTMVYYPVPLHKMKVFKGRGEIFSVLKESERVVNEVLSLPIEPLYQEETICQVIHAVKGFLNKK